MPQLPVNLAFLSYLEEQQQKSHFHYMKSHLEESCKIATSSATMVAKKNKQVRQACDPFCSGHWRTCQEPKHKITDKWESTVDVLVKRAGDLPIFTVKPGTGEGPWHTLHQDLFLPGSTGEHAKPKPAESCKTCQNTCRDISRSNLRQGGNRSCYQVRRASSV